MQKKLGAKAREKFVKSYYPIQVVKWVTGYYDWAEEEGGKL